VIITSFNLIRNSILKYRHPRGTENNGTPK
jgi:hypothetical protein